MHSKLIPVLAVMLLASSASAVEPSALVGDWYGENFQPVQKQIIQELTHSRADGTFEIEFRRYDNCVLVMDQKEAGTWSVTGSTLHTDTQFINSYPASYHDDYEIQVLDDKTFICRHIETDQIYTTTKVSTNFVIPECRIS